MNLSGRSLGFAFLAVLLLDLGEGVMQHLEEIRDRCRDEHYLLDEQISELNRTTIIETDDQNVKCFLKCMLIGLGIMTEEGEIILGEPSSGNYERIFPCKNVTGSDLCDKAANLRACMWKNLKNDEREEEEEEEEGGGE